MVDRESMMIAYSDCIPLVVGVACPHVLSILCKKLMGVASCKGAGPDWELLFQPKWSL